MTIGESFKTAINNAFRYTLFKKRDIDYFYDMFSTNIHGTNFTLIPPISKIKVKKIDEEHDELNLCYDDITISGVITWKKSNDDGFIFINYL